MRHHNSALSLQHTHATRLQKAEFKPTPKTGWWGASYWISAGPLESMEEAGQHVAKERKTFNEDDQANLYMQVGAQPYHIGED